MKLKRRSKKSGVFLLRGQCETTGLLKVLPTCPKHVPEHEGERHARIGTH